MSELWVRHNGRIYRGTTLNLSGNPVVRVLAVVVAVALGMVAGTGLVIPACRTDRLRALSASQVVPRALVEAVDRITIHVPEVLPDGSPLPADLLASYEDQLVEVALSTRLASGGVNEEGFTILTGAVGAWRSLSGKTYREPVRLYCVDVAEAEAVLADVRKLAERMRVELKQEAIYLTVSPIEAAAVSGLVVA